jgi:hypothetical protein
MINMFLLGLESIDPYPVGLQETERLSGFVIGRFRVNFTVLFSGSRVVTLASSTEEEGGFGL